MVNKASNANRKTVRNSWIVIANAGDAVTVLVVRWAIDVAFYRKKKQFA